jgi:hypothetical protein
VSTFNAGPAGAVHPQEAVFFQYIRRMQKKYSHTPFFIFSRLPGPRQTHQIFFLREKKTLNNLLISADFYI